MKSLIFQIDTNRTAITNDTFKALIETFFFILVKEKYITEFNKIISALITQTIPNISGSSKNNGRKIENQRTMRLILRILLTLVSSSLSMDTFVTLSSPISLTL